MLMGIHIGYEFRTGDVNVNTIRILFRIYFKTIYYLGTC
ncbi:hypothetical protein Phep_1119 [Pedobacter heparinus DSM 2366]|uniref:Uncharacterized protein n=1 Tax=Pedobacter heparinus (strain ATCC 13125 / DSM 2366 / CIP 104194 / JCM 7457 / NBRC 12017 / NCIMB 9290 / NRRL B-14731 / HIM 762-3) TaxID=485917 RepID=C6Y3Q8_PEDHD|nr:hypothetical protein Phep_1119 [Pedobacter heparinus DSM 2366]